MRPTGNDQGGYYFLSLESGRIINLNHATKLPMPNDVVEWVHSRMARQQKANPGLAFLDQNNQPYEEDGDGDNGDSDNGDDDDDSCHPDGYLEEDDEEDDDNDTYHPLDDVDHDSDDDEEANYDSDDDGMDDMAMDAESESDADDDENNDAPTGHGSELESNANDNEENIDVHGGDDNEDESVSSGEGQNSRSAVDTNSDKETSSRVPMGTDMDVKYGARSGVHNLQARKCWSYSHTATCTLLMDKQCKSTKWMTTKSCMLTIRCSMSWDQLNIGIMAASQQGKSCPRVLQRCCHLKGK
jgi:hypothetical protein